MREDERRKDYAVKALEAAQVYIDALRDYFASTQAATKVDEAIAIVRNSQEQK